MSKRQNLVAYCLDVGEGLVVNPSSPESCAQVSEFAETLLANGALADLLDADVAPDKVAEFITTEVKQWCDYSKVWNKAPFRLGLHTNYVKCILSNPNLHGLIKVAWWDKP